VFKLYFILLLSLLPLSLFGQSIIAFEQEVHKIDSSTSVITLAHSFVTQGSVVINNGDQLLEHGTDFRLFSREGIVRLLHKFAPDNSETVLTINYSFIPALLPQNIELHPLVAKPSKTLKEQVVSSNSLNESEYSYPGNLDVTGSKSVRISSGNRKEMTVDQTLRLAISGNLTEDIQVRAALSDNNLPVVPEGNTEELREIDKVLVEVKAPRWSAVLGDFTAEQTDSWYGGYRRKLQGAQVTVGDSSSVTLMGGSPRGRYKTLQIRGQESNQGPYYLSSGSTGQDLYIIAGTERVTLNGTLLTRGQDRDYVIDYVRGRITFTYKQLVTADSEIVVEYEEGQGQYSRTVAGTNVKHSVEVGELNGSFGLQLTRESDDPNRLRTGELTDQDIDALSDAGDSEADAVNDYVEITDAGDGQYNLTNIGGVDTYFWDENGHYNPAFYHTGSVLGDYGVDSLTVYGEVVYGYRGPGNGSYQIGKSLALPEQQQLATVTASVSTEDDQRATFEWNASKNDLNTLSNLDDGNNDGTALFATIDSGEKQIRAGLWTLGSAGIKGHYRKRDAQFSPFINRDKLFNYTRWGLGRRAMRSGFLQEEDSESSLTGHWRIGQHNSTASLEIGRQSMSHGQSLSANRVSGKSSITHNGISWQGALEHADAKDIDDPLDITRKLESHSISVNKGFIQPEISWRKSEDVDAVVSSAAGGYRLELWKAGLKSSPEAITQWEASFERGLADSLIAGAWASQRDSRTSRLALTSSQFVGMHFSGDGTLREVKIPNGAGLTTRLARSTLSADWKELGSKWSLAYSIDNSRAEVMDRQIVYLGFREGDYNQNGDFVGLNLGDYNVVTVGTDSLVATTEVSADLLWKQRFDFLGKDKFYSAWSTTTHLKARCRSLSNDMSRLLVLNPETLFDPEESVLGEVNWRQDTLFLKHLRRWDMRLLHEFTQALDKQYATHPEQRIRRNDGLIISCNISAVSSVRTHSKRNYEKRTTTEPGYSSNRSYDSLTSGQTLEWTYRPGGGQNYSFAVDYIVRDDAVSEVSQTEFGIEPKARFQLRSKWSGLAEFRVSEVSSKEPAGSLRPYFYPEDGNNNEITLRLIWEPTNSLSLSVSHFGRKRGDRGWQHDFRMESTARF
jgi:hypothetical protein